MKAWIVLATIGSLGMGVIIWVIIKVRRECERGFAGRKIDSNHKKRII